MFSIHDRRDRKRTLHDIVALLRQRIFSIALGYEDTNDAHTLKSDPALKIMSGRLPEADAGFVIPALHRFLEKQGISYLIGLITNSRLREKVAGLTVQARQAFQQTGQKQRRFTSFRYKADSWKRSRQVVAKVEWLPKGPNQRFVLSNLSTNAQTIYDDVYVMRGEAENRIKELKLDFKADRLSCHRFQANQFRLSLHTTAYCLFWLLRRHLQGTELSAVQAGTIRLKLLKIAPGLPRPAVESGSTWPPTIRISHSSPRLSITSGLLQASSCSPAQW